MSFLKCNVCNMPKRNRYMKENVEYTCRSVNRFLHNCQTCYFESEEGKRTQWYLPVSLKRRIELCEKFGFTCIWEPISGRETTTSAMVLDAPKRKEPLGELAEVGGECFFSSIYYLLVGRKSGISGDICVKIKKGLYRNNLCI